MARKAGSIVLDRLRDRILLGRYFGCWSPGDRLPSVREVAATEDVDRKTAAAAYRRLQKEGLVRVEARSGVYLRNDLREEECDPLRRLHRHWLEQTLTAATELGLDSGSVSRMLQAVSAVESHRIPVVDDDEDHAALLALELVNRTGLDCAGCRVRDLPAESGPLRDAPFAVATPTVSIRLRPQGRRMPIVHATLAPELLDHVGRLAGKGKVVVVVGTEGLARELRQAIEHGLVGPEDRITIERAASQSDVEALSTNGTALVAWPGAPQWAERVGATGNGRHLLADQTLREVRQQVARAALDYISRSSAA